MKEPKPYSIFSLIFNGGFYCGVSAVHVAGGGMHVRLLRRRPPRERFSTAAPESLRRIEERFPVDSVCVWFEHAGLDELVPGLRALQRVL